jgi:hypothetical protein
MGCHSVAEGAHLALKRLTFLPEINKAEVSEQQAFTKASAQFCMTEDSFKVYFETIAIKNNRSIFY